MAASSSVDRRQSDIQLALLTQQVNAVEKDGSGTKDMLARHVNECAALQKKGIVVGCLILGWLVAHSPEAGKLLTVLEKVF